jgi:hypothetical protein
MVRTGRNAGNFEFTAYWVTPFVLALLVQGISLLTCHHSFLRVILYHSGLTSSGDAKIVGRRLVDSEKIPFLHGLRSCFCDILRQLICPSLGTSVNIHISFLPWASLKKREKSEKVMKSRQGSK